MSNPFKKAPESSYRAIFSVLKYGHICQLALFSPIIGFCNPADFARKRAIFESKVITAPDLSSASSTAPSSQSSSLPQSQPKFSSRINSEPSKEELAYLEEVTSKLNQIFDNESHPSAEKFEQISNITGKTLSMLHKRKAKTASSSSEHTDSTETDKATAVKAGLRVLKAVDMKPGFKKDFLYLVLYQTQAQLDSKQDRLSAMEHLKQLTTPSTHPYIRRHAYLILSHLEEEQANAEMASHYLEPSLREGIAVEKEIKARDEQQQEARPMIEWLERFIEQQNITYEPTVLISLGKYRSGLGTKDDIELAIKHLKHAVILGDQLVQIPAYALLARVEIDRGNLESAKQYHESCLHLCGGETG